VYGIQPSAFSEIQQADLHNFQPEFSPGIVSQFLTIRWKRDVYDNDDYRERCRLGGAAMVASRRQAMNRIGFKEQGTYGQHELDST